MYSRTAGGHGCPLAAILCGGRSRRMGRDKALLPHPCGGSLLQHTCALALATGLETICLSRPDQGHRQHLATVPALRQVTVLEECPPWEGPLLALAKLMTTYPGHPMLLLACDLPNLTPPLLTPLLPRCHPTMRASQRMGSNSSPCWPAMAPIWRPLSTRRWRLACAAFVNGCPVCLWNGYGFPPPLW